MPNTGYTIHIETPSLELGPGRKEVTLITEKMTANTKYRDGSIFAELYSVTVGLLTVRS